MYIHLKRLVEGSVQQSPAQALREALDRLPTKFTQVTLDLEQSRGVFSQAQVEAIVEVMQRPWPHPAFCLARCEDVTTWNVAANRVGQPLLSWGSFVRREGGYAMLGATPRGIYATLLEALCLRHERATAEQLVRDSRIISPTKANYDAASQQKFALTGQPSLGPTLADESRIANDLRRMVEMRYILHIAPWTYSVVSPIAPS